MSKLHVYIDGTWLFKVVEGNVFDRFLVNPRYFTIDFNKLNSLMLQHIAKQHPECTELGNCYFVTSLFNIPADFDNWVGKRITHPYGGQAITARRPRRCSLEAIAPPPWWPEISAFRPQVAPRRICRGW